MTVLNQADAVRLGAQAVSAVYAGPTKVWPKVSASAYVTAVLADSPVAYYRLNETSGPAVDQMGGPGGVYNGSVVRGAASLLPNGDGASAHLTGGSVDVPDSAPTRLGGGDFTLEVWQTWDTLTDYVTPVDDPSHGGLNRAMAFFWYGTNAIYYGIGGSSGAISLSVTRSVGPANHTVYIVKAGVLTLGWNGAVASTSPVQASGGVNLAGFSIGGNPSGGGSPWPGRLQEFALYDHALTPAQVLAHYQAAA